MYLNRTKISILTRDQDQNLQVIWQDMARDKNKNNPPKFSKTRKNFLNSLRNCKMKLEKLCKKQKKSNKEKKNAEDKRISI